LAITPNLRAASGTSFLGKGTTSNPPNQPPTLIMLEGEKIFLKPTTPEGIPQFYAWATNPDPEVQRYYYGEKIPTLEEFLADYEPHFFDGSQPYRGRCYTILAEGKRPIGVVSYNGFDAERKRVTLDILIGNREDLGRGYGSDALRTLLRHLFETFPTLETAIIAAHRQNARAVRAYNKAGFRQVEVDANDPYIIEYADFELEESTFLELRRPSPRALPNGLAKI
jgi:RimJ/RimL family protein N-acetyltransferase